MTIFEKLDNAIAPLDVPWYDHMPEFAEGQEDPEFICYSLYDNARLFGDGSEQVTRYFITLSAFARSSSASDALRDRAAAALKGAGFIRSGGEYGVSRDFPSYYRRMEEYTYDLDLEI